ncbi:MAG: hypothetical protein APR55_01245 [Methanolinea sp. SDB]|nr:MAG: hypothetical protein APR55_01245 [Methanolinea sp. SDB]
MDKKPVVSARDQKIGEYQKKMVPEPCPQLGHALEKTGMGRGVYSGLSVTLCSGRSYTLPVGGCQLPISLLRSEAMRSEADTWGCDGGLGTGTAGTSGVIPFPGVYPEKNELIREWETSCESTPVVPAAATGEHTRARASKPATIGIIRIFILILLFRCIG